MILSVKALTAGLLIATAQIDPTPVDQQRAEMYFREAKGLCDRDNGRLWGVSLCGPMVFADVRTRTIATSEPAPPGERPGSIGFTNAPIEWGGTRWAAYVWTFIPADDRRARDELLMHELFHRIQPEKDASLAAARYRGIELRAAETERDRKLTARIAELRHRFVDGPVLILPGTGGGTFDIRGAVAIPGSGTVYFSTYRKAGDWGRIEASTGVLVSLDRATLTLPGPFRTEGRTLIGDGWTLTLASGWVVPSGPRLSDSQVVRDGR